MHKDSVIIPIDELTTRRDAMLSSMDEAGLDLAVFTSPAGVYYLSGFEFGGFATRHALLLRRDGASWFVVRQVEHGWQQAVQNRTWLGEWIFYPDSGDWVTTLAAAVAAALAGPSRVGAELSRTSLTHHEATTLAATPHVAHLADVAPVLDHLRAIKSDLEIELIRTAGRATAAGTLAAHAALGGGADDHEATLVAMRRMHEAGSGMVTDGPFVVTGSGSTLAHARASGRKPRDGELASTMMTASIGRYQCPLERTFPVGRGTPNGHEMIELTASATAHVMTNIGSGMSSHEADAVARDFYTRHGRSAGFTHRLGYSIGVAYPPLWWENDVMQLRPDDARHLEAGMVFHLVPGLHIEDLGFVNQSMTALITTTGCEPLSDLPLVLDGA